MFNKTTKADLIPVLVCSRVFVIFLSLSVSASKISKSVASSTWNDEIDGNKPEGSYIFDKKVKQFVAPWQNIIFILAFCILFNLLYFLINHFNFSET